jgi:aminoglycoside 6-adenylyltransferase
MHELLERIIAWGQRQEPVRVMILTGSRGADTADDLSDLDIAIFVTDSTIYTTADAWMREIADVWVYLALSNEEEGGFPTRLVIFEGGRKVDFTFSPVAALTCELGGPVLPDVYNRGYRVLLDKDSLAGTFMEPAMRAASGTPPSEREFRDLVDEFWFEAYHIPKYLARQELMLAKFRDWSTRELLLRLIGWHARTRHGWDYDTWYLGKHLRQWAEPEVWEALFACYGRFDAEDSWRAFFATIRLFDSLGEETARTLGYHYPGETAAHITGYAGMLYARLGTSGPAM